VYAGFRFVEKPSRFHQTLFGCSNRSGSLKDVGSCQAGEEELLTPANMTQHQYFPACTSPLLRKAMARFNAKHDWKLVSFRSRSGHYGQSTAVLKAWWLPVKDRDAPRVVIVHGNEANFNHFSVQVSAYLLRSMGFAVLLPNLRDHGNSDASVHRHLSWGWDYHLDVLGAWDYAVHDPQGQLGGKLSERHVSLMGFGIGAFASAIAFGLESKIPALWLDSVIFRPIEMLRWHLSHLVGPLAPAFTGVAWYAATYFAGVNITHMSPERALQLPHEKRYVAISHNRRDTVVPVSQVDEFVALIAELPLYSIEEQYIRDVTGCGRYDTHVVLPVWKPDDIRRRMCEFWSGAFGRFSQECRLDELPEFDTIFADPSFNEKHHRSLEES
jgi:hypothetical protein